MCLHRLLCTSDYFRLECARRRREKTQQQVSVLEKVVSGFEQKLWKLTYTTNPLRPHGIGCIFVAIAPISKLLDVLKSLELSPKVLLIRFMLQWIFGSVRVAKPL